MRPKPRALAIWQLTVTSIVSTMLTTVIVIAGPDTQRRDLNVANSPERISNLLR